MVDPPVGGCVVCFGVGVVASFFLFFFLDEIMDPGLRSGRLFLPLFLPGPSLEWLRVFPGIGFLYQLLACGEN